ncbi:hypothetical protein ANN_04108 [Periplaneta americana]|uniref:Uncharacterized protein n=1 Tax=Periplaneta americana TaxID=6978 RepID=A0ABQ8T8V0_PERAM|nr:hypothetical protein ANN_04108 [Periplaneta americana]
MGRWRAYVMANEPPGSLKAIWPAGQIPPSDVFNPDRGGKNQSILFNINVFTAITTKCAQRTNITTQMNNVYAKCVTKIGSMAGLYEGDNETPVSLKTI